jgi:hypothetical protein
MRSVCWSDRIFGSRLDNTYLSIFQIVQTLEARTKVRAGVMCT